MSNFYTGEYYETWAYGGYHTQTATVYANCESEALGFFLEYFGNTKSLYWCVTEVAQEVGEVTELDYGSS